MTHNVATRREGEPMSSWSSDQPWQSPPTSSRVSAQLIARVYATVLEDPSMVAVVAVGTLVESLVFAGIAVPAWLIGGVDLLAEPFDLRALLLYVVVGWATAFVGIVFSGAVVAAGAARLDGQPISPRAALAVAWGRRRQLLAWALVTTGVGLLAEQLNRFGIAGSVLRLAADIAWGLATLLVLPVIIVEGRMPREAITESVSLVKGRLVLSVRSRVRLAVPWIAAMILASLVTAAGVLAFVHYRHETPEWAAMGLVLAGVGLLALVFVICVQSAAEALLNLMLYRHALGLPLPGVDASQLPRLVTPGPPLPG
jgi:Family of unknown function (DUF6159)